MAPKSSARRGSLSRRAAEPSGAEAAALVEVELPSKPAAPARAVSFQLALIYGNVALYALAYMLQQPAQPFLVKSLPGGDAMQFGLFKTYMQALQLLGTLFTGVLIDALGPKKLIVVSFAVSAASYAMTAHATTLPLLYASQIPTILQHAVLGARAAVTLASDESARARMLGLVSVAYGVGMVIGPAAGGILSNDGNYALVSYVASLLSVVSAVLIYFFLDDASSSSSSTSSSASASASAPAAQAKAPVALRDYLEVFSNAAVSRLLAVKLLFGLSSALFHSVFSLVAAERFGLDAKGTGYVISYVGFLGAVTNGLLIEPSRRYASSERALLLATGGALAASFAAFSVTTSATELYVLCVPLVIASGIFQTVSSAQLTTLVPRELAGSANAVDMGIGSGVRMVSPLVSAGLLGSSFGFPSVGAASSGLAILCVLLLLLSPAAAAAAPTVVGKAATAAAKAAARAAKLA
jgi:MFS family permease